MSARVRLACPADLGELLTLAGEAEQAAGGEAGLSRALDPDSVGHLVLVSENDCDLAGYIHLHQVADEITIMDLRVNPLQRRQGLARQLLSQGMLRAGRHGARRCLLEVRESNHAALALYRTVGFQQDGLRRGYYPGQNGREDAILMSWELPTEAVETTP